jgi:hypothetical protein
MSTSLSSSKLIRGTVEAMFEYLDKVERELGNTGKGSAVEMRSSLGLPKYRFIDRPHPTGAFSCGAPVKFVFLGVVESRKRADAVGLTPKSVPAATVSDPDTCGRKGLCFPHLVRQEFRICDQHLVVTRNAAPYGRNHGVVRSAEHEPQSLCFEPFRLRVALSVARALGSDTGPSDYEVWVAGEGFNTQWHFHVQFRRQRGPIWLYVDERQGRLLNPGLLEEYPSRPIYFESNNGSQLVETLYREISPFLPTSQSEEEAGSVPHRPAIGLLLSYERASWRAILVRSWYPPGERLFGKQPGLHEHLGEVILESEDELQNVHADLSASTESFEKQLKSWCQPKNLHDAG